MTRTLRGLGLLAAAAAMVLVPVTRAHADAHTISINIGAGWVHDSSTPLFAVNRFAPGMSQSAAIEVRNDSSDPADLTLSSANIVDYENGCVHSEAIVDTTCGALQGELGHELVFSVYADPKNDGNFDATPRWTGTLFDLTTPVDLLTNMSGGAVVPLRVRMTLPSLSGNETQTDSVNFGLRLTLSDAGTLVGGSSGGTQTQSSSGPGSTEVKGIKVIRHQHNHGLLPDIAKELPFTGSAVGRWAAGSAWLVIAGLLICLLSRKPKGRGA